MANAVVWLEPWTPISTDELRHSFATELIAEVGEGHALFGIGVQAIAKRIDNDSVLFALRDGQVASVHLTWSQSRESAPYPRTSIFSSLNEWRQTNMHSDYIEYAEQGRDVSAPP